MLEDSRPPRADRKTRILIGIVSVLVTGALLALTLGLGAWAYDIRRNSLHHGRLERLNEQHPKVGQVVVALRTETGKEPLPTPRTEDDLRRLVATWGSA